MNVKKKNMILIAVIALGGLAIGATRVTSQCSQCSSLEAAFSPPPVAQPVQTVVSRPLVTPVVVQRPIHYVNRPVSHVVSRPASVCPVDRPISETRYRTVAETEMREEEITTYETVWEEQTRYRQKTISKQVPETSVKTETIKVLRPVWETVEKETSYDVVRYVQETSEREEVSTISRPVTQMQEKQIVETVNRPVESCVIQQKEYTVNRPVTTIQQQTQDVGRYVTQYTPQQGRSYNRLTWQPGGDYYDPATGTTKRRLPGLYWTQLSGPTQYTANRVWQSNLVTTAVPVTTYVQEKVVENVPTKVTTYQQEQIVRTEQVPVTTYQQEQVVKKIPVTTYKPVTERVVQKTPVKVCRMQTEEQVREIPVTTYKTVCEVVNEPYTVRVAKQVPKVVKVQRPVTVYKQITETVKYPTNPCESGLSQSTISTTPATTTYQSDSTSSSRSPQGNSASAEAPSLPASKPVSDPVSSTNQITTSKPVVYPGPISAPSTLSTENKEQAASPLPSIPDPAPIQTTTVNKVEVKTDPVVPAKRSGGLDPIIPIPARHPQDVASTAPNLGSSTSDKIIPAKGEERSDKKDEGIAPANHVVPAPAENPVRTTEYQTRRPLSDQKDPVRETKAEVKSGQLEQKKDLGSFGLTDQSVSNRIPAPPTIAPTQIMENR